ncbi:TMEM175 family protein [soil metagenome]
MEKETGRIEAFSDGIFSVAITLLALEIGIKEMPEGHINDANFWHEILALWPKFFAYFNSFASVLLMWMSHHKIFRLLRGTNTYIILANGFLLLITALVPFPVKTVGEYIQTDAASAAIIFYNGYSVLMCFGFWLLSYTILKNKQYLLPGKLPLKLIQESYRGIFIGLLCTIVIVGVAFLFPYSSLVLNFGMWVFWAFLSHSSEEGKVYSDPA